MRLAAVAAVERVALSGGLVLALAGTALRRLAEPDATPRCAFAAPARPRIRERLARPVLVEEAAETLWIAL